MKYKISESEKNAVMQFQKMHIPTIFKTDATGRILFVEDVDFHVCNSLLKGKSISIALYKEILERSKEFIEVTDVNEFDDYALSYYNLCLHVVEILKKYQI